MMTRPVLTVTLIVLPLLAACTEQPVVAPDTEIALKGGPPSRNLQWTALSDMPQPAGAGAAATDGSFIYLIGGGAVMNTLGNANQIYDVETGTWYLGAPVPGTRAFAMAGALRDGIHLVGGVSQETDHQVYDRRTDSWSSRAALPVGVRAGVAEVVRRKLYIIGGVGSAVGVTNVVQIYDPATDSWSTGAPMPTPRLSAVSTVIGGKIYVAGGEEPGLQTSDALEVYDPRRNVWTVLDPLPFVRESMGGGNIDNSFCMFGGRLTFGYPTGDAYEETHCYTPRFRAWRLGPVMLTPRVNMGSVELNGEVYGLGGRLNDALLPTAEKLGR